MARSVACGSAYTLIATESGVLYGCGLRDLLAQPSPIRKKDRQDTGLIPIGPFYDEQCVAVTVCAARNDYSCVSSGQDLWHFGYCRYLATCLKRPKPLELDIEGASVRKISVGAFSGALLSTKGKIYVWGDGTHSELGGIPYSQAPVELKQEERFLDVACGENHTIAVSQSGGLYVVGDNTASQCGAESFARGYGGKRVTEFLSVQPTCPFSGFAVSVCAGNQHSTLLTNMHRLYLWGSNTEGKLGHSSKVSRENQRINTLSLCYRLINRTVEAVAAKNNATVIICSPARDDEVSSGEESEEKDKSEKKFRMKSKVIPGARIVKSAVGITRIVDLPKTDKDHDTAKYFNDLSMYTSPEYGSCFEGNSLGDCSPSAASSSPGFMSQTTPGITAIGDWISLQSGSIMAKNRGLIQMNSEVARFVRNRQVTNKACDSRGITERRRMVTNLPDRPTSPRDQYLELEDDVIYAPEKNEDEDADDVSERSKSVRIDIRQPSFDIAPPELG